MKPFQYLAPIAPFDYLSPTSMDELLEALEAYHVNAEIIAGGTDLTIMLKQRLVKSEVIIDISRMRAELAGIAIEHSYLKIGAMTTLTEIERDTRVERFARALSHRRRG